MKYIPTHYIMGTSGDVVRVNNRDIIVWSVWKDKNNTDETVAYANQHWIHIEMVWNFDTNKPTEKQYEALRVLIAAIDKRAWKILPVKKHSDFQTKSCPWKNFDMNELLPKEIRWLDWEVIASKEPKPISFNISRYYSVEKNQKKYMSDKTWYISSYYTDKYKANGYTQWYERDVCMNCGCRLDWVEKKLYDCSKPADSIAYQKTDKYKAVACPKEYPLGTKIYLLWLWDVTCRDRWWAINENRLDVWMWYGDEAIDNRDKVKSWLYNWQILSFTKN